MIILLWLLCNYVVVPINHNSLIILWCEICENDWNMISFVQKKWNICFDFWIEWVERCKSGNDIAGQVRRPGNHVTVREWLCTFLGACNGPVVGSIVKVWNILLSGKINSIKRSMIGIFYRWTIFLQALNVFAKVDDSHSRTKDSLVLVDGYTELDVVEIDVPLKPVLHGTIVRITSKDKLCHLRMSDKKYPVKWGRGSVYHLWCGFAGTQVVPDLLINKLLVVRKMSTRRRTPTCGRSFTRRRTRSSPPTMISLRSHLCRSSCFPSKDVFDPDSPVVFKHNASVSVVRLEIVRVACLWVSTPTIIWHLTSFLISC